MAVIASLFTFKGNQSYIFPTKDGKCTKSTLLYIKRFTRYIIYNNIESVYFQQ